MFDCKNCIIKELCPKMNDVCFYCDCKDSTYYCVSHCGGNRCEFSPNTEKFPDIINTIKKDYNI